MTDRSRPSSPWFELASPPGIREVATVLTLWLVVSIAALVLIPIDEYPLMDSSWDVLHSGRRFADIGFIASKLQPRWTPQADAAAYLNYTHYPPFPYWFSGVVQSIVSSPEDRIRTMLGIMRVLACLTLALAYLVVRQTGVGVTGGALAVAAFARSVAWKWVASEMSWIAWLPLFLFAGIGALLWAARDWQVQRRGPLILGGASAVLAALCAFDVWLWFPVFSSVLLLGARGRERGIRRLLLAVVVMTSCATGVAVATRLAINTWHFGSVGAAVHDWQEALTVRATGGHAGLNTLENAVNYKVSEGQVLNRKSRLTWIGFYVKDLPRRLEWLYAPVPPPEARILFGVVLLALPVACIASVRRWRGDPEGRFWPGPLAVIVAAALANVPFVLVSPAITVQQPFSLLTQAPAVLILLGSILHAALDPVGRLAGFLLGKVRARAAVAAPALILALWAPLDTLKRDEPRHWPVPLPVCRAAAEAVAGVDGVVFVNAPNANPLMFLVPLTSRVAIKPFAELQKCPTCFQISDPIRLLAIDRPQGSSVETSPGWTDVAPEGLPGGWRLHRSETSLRSLGRRLSPDTAPPAGPTGP